MAYPASLLEIEFRPRRRIHSKFSIPLGLSWRSNTIYILSTVVVALLGDVISHGMVIPILPSILRDEFGVGEHELQRYTSALIAIFTGLSMICSPLAGIFADRTESRKIPLVAGLTTFIAAIIFFFGTNSLHMLLLAKAIQGASSSFVWTAGFSLCFDTVGIERMGTTLGTVLSIVDVGTLLSPPLGGLIYGKVDRASLIMFFVLVLLISLGMAGLMIEKKAIFKYSNAQFLDEALSDSSQEAAEDLLPRKSSESDSTERPSLEANNANTNGTFGETITPEYKLPPCNSGILRAVPILMCLRNPSLIVAILVCAVQAALLGAFDATIPLEAKNLFGFNTLQGGLLFIPVGCARLVTGPLGGWAVDNYGAKRVAIVGYSYLVPILLTFRFVKSEPKAGGVVFYCVLLALCGVGMAVVSTVSFVEAGAVVERYHKSNPRLFGPNGPFASLFGLNLMVFSFGMTFGSLLAGDIEDLIGYGNMMAILAGFALLSALASYFWLGERKSQIIQ